MNEQQPYISRRERRELERKQNNVSSGNNPALKRFLLWAGVSAAIIAGVAGLYLLSSLEPANQTIGKASPISENDWKKGNASATVSVVEYGDFQCPACGSYFPIVERVNSEFGDRIQFAFRHFPLKEVHKNAETAAYASEAAGNQGKFWEMHDMLFKKQSSWSNLSSSKAKETFAGYAKDLSLDVEQFSKDMDALSTSQKVAASRKEGEDIGVHSTPSFFINGEKIDNPNSYEEFRDLIERQLNVNS